MTAPEAQVAVIPNPVTDPCEMVTRALLNAVAGVRATAAKTGKETPLRFRLDTSGSSPCNLNRERQGSASLR